MQSLQWETCWAGGRDCIPGVLSLSSRMPAVRPDLMGMYRLPSGNLTSCSCAGTTRAGLSRLWLEGSGSLAGFAFCSSV